MCLAIDSTVCFRKKTGPCKPTVIQPKAGVELSPFWIEQNALTASVLAWLKRLSFKQGVSARLSTAVLKQIPIRSGRGLNERYPDDAAPR
jgi:cyanate permease